ncbi:hypothetical protein ACUNV4_19430 [Granulosicoccus sp. 3-233]|uniref:hypothetical protein n=1 Tax=Granulosicoccus sp. 3-233 TaxID=3417969 RepID=UPI003D32B441
MEGRAAWLHQQQSCIGFDELTSMVSELMSLFVREQDHACVSSGAASADWVSPSGLTRVIRHGSSAALHSVLNQVPDAIAAEFEVIHCDIPEFSWCEYLWPHLQRSNACQRQSMQISLPATCLVELMNFHEQHQTSWLRRYMMANPESSLTVSRRRAQVNKIGIVAEPDRFQLL